MRWILAGFIRLWRRFISPLYGDVCRYYPSCSAFGLRAIEYHGALRGTWLTVRRIASCHPWAEGGVQFVPGTPEAADWAEEERRRAAARDSATSGPVAAPYEFSVPTSSASTTGAMPT